MTESNWNSGVDDMLEEGLDTFDGDILDLSSRRLNQLADFTMVIGRLDQGKEPRNLLETPEANKALECAYAWACEKEDSNIYAANATAYIENIEQNREWEADTPTGKSRADVTQLLYVMNNLTYWRGEEARESKKILNAYIDERKGN